MLSSFQFKLIIVFGLLIGVLSLVYFHKFKNKNNIAGQKAGTIIILNGPSASGKSSIQQKVQDLFPEFFVRIGIDSFFDALLPEPDLSQFEKEGKLDQFTKDGQLIRRIELKKDKEGNQIVPLEIGPVGDRVIFGMHRAIAGYAQVANNVIVDYILYDPQWLPDLVETLKDYKVYFVGTFIPLGVLEQREKARGTSPVGHGRSHYDVVHQPGIYDLKLDTSVLSPEESALKIREFIANNPNPTAFKQLSNMFEKS
jgi:chloramphenicol 3-O phosphotransferase